MSGGRTLGQVVDALGCELDLDDDALVQGVIVLLHVVKPDGTESLMRRTSEGMGWIVRRGMMEVAAQIERDQVWSPEEGEE